MEIRNNSGLKFRFLENGTIQSIESDHILINLKKGHNFSYPGINIYLRVHSGKIEFIPLTGPESRSEFSFSDNRFYVKGSWKNIMYNCELQLSEKSSAWRWHISLKNLNYHSVILDLVYAQEVGLKNLNDGLVNEYYVAQYLERLIFDHEKYGKLICCRQNMKESGVNPWLLLAGTGSIVAGSTDGNQFFGSRFRENSVPGGLLMDKLEGNCAAESPVIALQTDMIELAREEEASTGFIGIFEEDHPLPSSEFDLDKIPAILNTFSDRASIDHEKKWHKPAHSIIDKSGLLPSARLNNEEISEYFGRELHHEEFHDGELLSFFSEDNHVVLKDKEILAHRPHAHIIQANSGFIPDESIMSTTCFAAGVFNSHISQGNTNFNVLLSVNTSQFNLDRISGQRIFVEISGQLWQLGIPSAFEMGFNHCRWIYKFEGMVLQVRTWTAINDTQINTDIRLLQGNPVRLFISHDFDRANSWKIIPGDVSNEFIAAPREGSIILDKFPEARFRFRVNKPLNDFQATDSHPMFTCYDDQLIIPFLIETEPVSEFYLSIAGEVTRNCSIKSTGDVELDFMDDMTEAAKFKKTLTADLVLNGDDKNTAALNRIIPWYGLNALIHFLTPYGIEQFSGAAWGTRDVSQGPIELLLATGKYKEARMVLMTIFSNQNTSGDWPQWWMFDSYRHVRAGDCHGDVYYWVMIALANYIRVTGDLSILDEKTPYFGDNDTQYPVSEHIERLIAMIMASFIPGTSLVPFGGGDWNDSLQPVSKELASRLISSWTVEMNFQAFKQYQEVYSMANEYQKAAELGEICDKILKDFNQYLVSDGVVTGYGLLEENGLIDVLLHPLDTRTGIGYSLLPMNRGVISAIFTPRQAQMHQELINSKLKGPDGARLMDRPLKYRGGVQEIFQRAESSTYFGREIGLMYMHEHIRYAESQAILGNADEFVKALRQAIPIDYTDIVPNSDLRQSNCYYTSSDAIFASRYDADKGYEEVIAGKKMVIGGWRVYSSGPGIFLGIIITRLLGFRPENDKLILDPLIPRSMDGLSATIDFKGYKLQFNFKLTTGTHTPKSISINQKAVPFILEKQRFRDGGAVIRTRDFLSRLTDPATRIDVEL
jgi:cellobiose phosphorylase